MKLPTASGWGRRNYAIANPASSRLKSGLRRSSPRPSSLQQAAVYSGKGE